MPVHEAESQNLMKSPAQMLIADRLLMALRGRHVMWLFTWLALGSGATQGHVIPPEKLHPVAEAYRRAEFILNLNPVVWEQVRSDVEAIAGYWSAINADAADTLLTETNRIITEATLRLSSLILTSKYCSRHAT